MGKTPKRPRDPNQLAKLVLDIAIGEITDPAVVPVNSNNPKVRAGRAGGLKGGKARAEKLTATDRSAAARRAAKARWKSTDA